MTDATISIWLQLAWFVATVLFITALRHLSSPIKARQGIWLAGAGMVIVIASMAFHPQMSGNFGLIVLAMFCGSMLSLLHARKVDMTRMPQMIALYNGLGGLAAAGVATLVLLHAPLYGAFFDCTVCLTVVRILPNGKWPIWQSVHLFYCWD